MYIIKNLCLTGFDLIQNTGLKQMIHITAKSRDPLIVFANLPDKLTESVFFLNFV